jgi:DNA-binding GntR family transcriptional regulator
MRPASQPDPRAYMRLAALIREQVARGEILGGTALPPITDIRRKHGHSRQTAGKALRVLEDEGVVYRVPGLGYFASVTEQSCPGHQTDRAPDAAEGASSVAHASQGKECGHERNHTRQ